VNAVARLPGVLVVDDEPRSCEALARTLDESFDVLTAGDAEAAIAIMEREGAEVQIVVCDQRMPGKNGVALLTEIRNRWPDTVRIMLSGYTDSQDIITGINEAGIYQFLHKPWQPEQLLLTLKGAAEAWSLQQDNQRLSLELRAAVPQLRRRVEDKRAQARRELGLEGLVRAKDSPLNAIVATLARVAPFDLAVLIVGESGTGKEMLARALHYQSPRADKPFVVENCGALPDQLLEAELFGYKRGAFTGAYEDRVGRLQQADGGTLFLDEIGDTSPAFQVKLLRVLQEGEFRPLGAPRPVSVDLRVVAATNRKLDDEVRAGRFREDLYYRLATVTLRVPPLRERPGDVPLIARHLLAQATQSLGKPCRGFTNEVLACFASYRWPGNVRELQNEVLRMLALADGEALGAELLAPRVLRAPLGGAQEEALSLFETLAGGLKERMEQLEMRVIEEALLRHRWNKTRVAQELGLSRVGLRGKLARFGLEKK
jgi:two-component system response regulator HupR/HoxA